MVELCVGAYSDIVDIDVKVVGVDENDKVSRTEADDRDNRGGGGSS